MSVRSVRSALAFLTVIPVAAEDGTPGERLGRAYFPAVGALVGLGAGAVLAALSTVASPLLAAVAAVAALAVLTGGLHLDGLADSADGLLGGASTERRLEIMRDPRVGVFGVVALVLALGAQVAALAAMAPSRALLALVIAGCLSRWAMVGVVAALPYVRPAGLGMVAGGRRRFDLAAATVQATFVFVLDWRLAAVAAVAVVLAAGGMAMLARARIGGATGDVYGGACELAQLGALVAMSLRHV